MRISAAVAHGPGHHFAIETLELDEPRADEILVRVEAVGICHTDLFFRDMATFAFPAVFGHEGAGIVERVGKGINKVAVGDKVLLTFRSCGVCSRCTSRASAYCTDLPLLNFTGRRPDGSAALHGENGAVSGNFFGQSSFASHALAYERNVVKIPHELSSATYAPLGCGVQTGAGAIMRTFACPAGASLVVIGGGAVGLSAVMAGVIQGCSPIVLIEPVARRRTLARELGASHSLNPDDGATSEQLRPILPNGADFVFDTSGSVSALTDSLSYVASHGVLGMVAAPATLDTTLNLPILLAVSRGLTLKGIIEGDSEPDDFIPTLIRLHREGRFPFDRLIQLDRFENINEAVAAQRNGQIIKSVLLMDPV